MSILKFDDQIKWINVWEVILAIGFLFEVIEKHKHNSCNFLPTEKVKDFGNFFDQWISVIFEEF